MKNENSHQRLRIILAIAGKDILDALRNKILLSIILGVALIMVQGKALPLLLKISDTVQVAVWQPDSSSVAEALRTHDRIRVIEVASEQELEQTLVEASGMILGIVVPSGYAVDASSGGERKLDGYYAYWMGEEKVAELETLVEAHLSGVSGAAVEIDTEGHVLYAQPDSRGQLLMTALVMVLMTTLVCLIIVPFLMIEEKEARTLQSLLVSPARIGQVIIGKAMVGVTYGLVAGAVVLAFNQAVIVHWWIAIAACVAGSLLTVGLGLLLGSLCENIATMNLWMILLMVVLLVPIMVTAIVPVQMPTMAGSIMAWIPPVALYKTFILSFTADPSIAQVTTNLGIVFGSAAVVLVIVAGIVRRYDR